MTPMAYLRTIARVPQPDLPGPMEPAGLGGPPMGGPPPPPFPNGPVGVPHPSEMVGPGMATPPEPENPFLDAFG